VLTFIFGKHSKSLKMFFDILNFDIEVLFFHVLAIRKTITSREVSGANLVVYVVLARSRANVKFFVHVYRDSSML